MSSETIKKWVEAAMILGEDPSAVVRCPVCGKDNLKVTDVRVKTLHERSMRCPSCGARNDIRMANR
jgi:hypothetical protein